MHSLEILIPRRKINRKSVNTGTVPNMNPSSSPIMEKIKFNSAFTFKYSPRPYTKAEQFTDQIDETIKKERLDKLINLQKKHTLELNSKKIGQVENVLIEKESKKSSNHWAGRIDSNEWVILEKNSSKIKDIIPVEIIDATGVVLHGKEIVRA